MASKALDKCLKTLRTSESDNEKFAALLVVTKIIKSGTCLEETRREIFEAIGFHLLRRLLKTGQTPDGCPDFAYKNLAVVILHTFCTRKELVTSSEMFDCLIHLNAIVTYEMNTTLDEDDIESQKTMVKECYECLVCIAEHPKGRRALIRHKTVTALCLACSSSLYGCEQAQKLLHHLIVMTDPDMWDNNLEGLQLLIVTMSDHFAENESEEKFVICDKLGTLFQSISKGQIHRVDSAKWCTKIHSTLTNILRSKLGKHQRNAAIKLASVLTDLLGVQWALGPSEDTHKFLLLLVHLACIEVRMLLEMELDFDKICSSETSHLLSCCYNLLENVISYMTSGPSLQLNEKQVKQLHAAMVGAFNAVISFLSEVSINQPEMSQNTVVLASIRVLGAWMAEETTALHTEILQLLPFLVKVSKESFEVIKFIEPKTQTAEQECHCGQLPTRLGHMTDELRATKLEAVDISGSVDNDNMGSTSSYTNENVGHTVDKSKLGKCEKCGHKKMWLNVDIVRFLLPGLCHLTADEHARNTLKDLELHVLLGEYFSFIWKKFQHSNQQEDAWVALATLCGIFLNLIILDQELITSHQVFSELLAFIVITLPGLAKSSGQLVLNFNLAVVGMMLFRYLVPKIDMSQGECDKFFNAVISLFRRAHTVQKSEEGVLVLSLSDQYQAEWDEISELWFLGMQALSECVPRWPSLTSCVLSSAWVTGLLKSLTETTGQTIEMEVLVSFQRLLSAMAGNNGKAKQVILEKGGIQVAKAYKMAELSLILKG